MCRRYARLLDSMYGRALRSFKFLYLLRPGRCMHVVQRTAHHLASLDLRSRHMEAPNYIRAIHTVGTVLKSVHNPCRCFPIPTHDSGWPMSWSSPLCEKGWTTRSEFCLKIKWSCRTRQIGVGCPRPERIQTCGSRCPALRQTSGRCSRRRASPGACCQPPATPAQSQGRTKQ